MEIQKLINQRQGEILGLKAILNATDWEVIKATELGEPVNDEIKRARSDARYEINKLEDEISELEKKNINELAVIPDGIYA